MTTYRELFDRDAAVDIYVELPVGRNPRYLWPDDVGVGLSDAARLPSLVEDDDGRVFALFTSRTAPSGSRQLSCGWFV